MRLDKTSLPAPAVASLYLNGTGARMLAPERALYQAAMHLTWPQALIDDDEYLCCQISELLLEDVERVGIDRNLPRYVCPDSSNIGVEEQHLSIAHYSITTVANESLCQGALQLNGASLGVSLPDARH